MKGEIRERWERVIPTRREPFRNFSNRRSAAFSAFTQMITTILFYELGGKIAGSLVEGKYGE